MKKLWDYIKQYKIRFSFFAGIILLFGLLLGLRHIESFSEFWTTTIGRAYQTIVGFVTSIVPWSIFEWLIIAAIVYIVGWIVLFIIKTKKEGFKSSSIKIVDLTMVVFSVITIYLGTAGMAYHRKPLQLNIANTENISKEKYYEISMWATNELNECASQLTFEENGSVNMPYSKQELYNKLRFEYGKINDPYLTKFTAKPKQLILFGWLYTELNISGVSFLPSGEANYNQNIPNIDIPFVIAHEIAHAKGVMNETEANDLAMYVCANSDDPYIRYSALCNAYEAFESMAMTCNDEAKMNTFYNALNANVWNDFSYSNDFWSKHTLFKDISEWFNNLYLKVFGGQTTDSYIDVVDDEIVIIDDDPVYTINALSPYQQIVSDLWLKENGH